MPRIISYYIFKEMIPPFLISLLVLSATALLSKVTKIVELSLNYGVDSWSLLILIISFLPSFLIYTIPISFLVSVIVAFNRLSSEGELTAMRASGLSLLKLSRPVFFSSTIMFLITLLFTMYLFPSGNKTLKKIVYNIVRTKTVSGIKEQTFNTYLDGLTIYVGNIANGGKELKDIFISDTRADKDKPTIIFARRGMFSPAKRDSISITLRLFNGSIHHLEDRPKDYSMVSFNTYNFEIPLKGKGTVNLEENRTNRELYVNELMERIREKGEKGENQAPYIIDLHKRFALPFSTFIFALLGIPFGIQKIRSVKLTSYTISLCIVLVYYLLSTSLESIGENGLINPVLSVWGSDIIMGIAGFYIFAMIYRESSILSPRFRERFLKAVHIFRRNNEGSG